MRGHIIGLIAVLLVGVNVALADSPAAPATQSAAAAGGPPGLITLHFKDANPGVVLAELAKQGQVNIAQWPPDLWNQQVNLGNILSSRPKLSIDIDQQPFWAAMVEFCNKAKVQVRSMGNEQDLTVMQGEGNFSAPHCFSGSFAIFANNAQRTRSLQYADRGNGAGQVQKNDVLTLDLYIDPRSRVASYDGIQISEAVDDKGASLVVDAKEDGGRSSSGMMQRGYSFPISVPLKYPNDGYTKLSRLKGTILLIMVAKTKTLEIPDFEKSSGQSASGAGMNVSVKSVKLGGQELSYELDVSRDKSQPSQGGGLFEQYQSIHIVDAHGHTICSGGGGWGSDEEMTVSGSYGVGGVGKIAAPLKLVWEIPTETREENIKFELDDLPLPQP